MSKRLKDHFIPHHGNNHHPHFWRKRSVGFLIAVIILVEALILSQSLFLFKSDSFLASILPGVLVSLTNKERAHDELSVLTTNSLLEQAAKLKAEDMATRGYFAHNTPEGYLPWYWLQKVGYNYVHAGENLAVNFTDSEDVIRAWMNSPAHRDNILKQNYTEIGIGMSKGVHKGKSAIFIVQFFGHPTEIMTQTNLTPNLIPEITEDVVIELTPANIFTVTPVETNKTEVLGSADDEMDDEVKDSAVVETLVASPRHTATIIYSIIFTLILIVLLLTILVKIKIQHPKVIMIGIILLVLIGVVIFVNSQILNSVVVASTTELPIY